MGEALLFYTFSTILIFAASMVVVAVNPVHSVLFLILTFLNAAGLFVLLHAELLAMSLIIVYVGAVAVLFLFIVMMLDINFADLRQGAAKYGTIGAIVGLIFAIELLLVSLYWPLPTLIAQPLALSQPSNTQAIGLVLYTDYFIIFQLSGLILLVAMIGAIVLTIRQRPGVRRQDIGQQMARYPENTLTLNDVEPGQGVKL